MNTYTNMQLSPTPFLWNAAVVVVPPVGVPITGSDAAAPITGSDSDAEITGSD